MKHKVEELEGALLDTAVAKAEGWSADEVAAMVTDPDGANRYIAASTCWGIGGPILERERITVGWIEFGAPHWPGQWYAQYSADNNHHQTADTPLIAAMRTYVASKCGDEVELP
jgi:hypothetical protein